MFITSRLYGWYGKRNVWLVVGAIVVLIIIGIFLGTNGNKDIDTGPTLRTVGISRVSNISNVSRIELVGNVEAIDEAKIESEAVGRVTSVSVSLGEAVSAGQIIAQLENASERASVLQAEGAYEAALAIAAQSDIGVEETLVALRSAENNAVTAYRKAYITADDIIRNLADELYADPTFSVPGLRIDGGQYTLFLNNERVAFVDILETWKRESTILTIESNLELALTDAYDNTLRLFEVVDVFSKRIAKEKSNAIFSEADLASYKIRFQAARLNLVTTLTGIDIARTTLLSATEARDKAKIAGTNTELSLSNANVKQALGVLRAAQANLAKTIFRTPISGTVNLLSVKTGDFINMFSRVATVANNNALLITTFVGEADRNRLTIGDTVTIENKYRGTITNIAPAIDPLTKKIEVKIQTETDELANGDTVRVTIASEDTDIETDEIISVPLTAIKFSATDGSVFTVDNGVIIAHSVTLGPISGSNVLIEEGLTSDMEIILDVRGLNAGLKVEPILN